MEKIMNKNSTSSKILCCMISILLVVSMMVIPAYGSDLLVAVGMDVAAEANQQDETISAPDAASPDDQLSTCRDEDGVGPAEGGTEGPDADGTENENTVSGEDNGELGPPLDNGDDTNGQGSVAGPGSSEGNGQDEEDNTPVITPDQIATTMTAKYDRATRTINCTFTVRNDSDYQAEPLHFGASVTGNEDLLLKVGEPAYYEFSTNDRFSLSAHESKNVSFSMTVLPDVQLEGIDPALVIEGYVVVGEGIDSFTVRATDSVEIQEPEELSLSFDFEKIICDAQGNSTGSESMAVPGNIVNITYTVTNTGASTVDVVFSSKGSLELFDSEDAKSIPAGESVTIYAVYPVTEEDANSGSVVATLFATAGDTTLEFSEEICKVGTEFEYYLRYIYDGEDYGVGAYFMAEVGTEVTLTSDEITTYMPDALKSILPANGYTITYTPLTVTSNPANNYIDVVYSTASYPYTVNYYVDNTDNNPIAAYTLEAGYLADISLDSEALNRHKPAGYKDLTVSPVLLITDNPDANVLNVVYSEKEEIGYTIRYFVDSADSTPVAMVPGVAPYGSDLVISASDEYGQLNYALPAGYTPFTEAYTHQIKATASENMIDVVYSAKNFYPLTINYYYDAQTGEPESTLTTDQTYEFGSTISIDEDVLNAYILDGYAQKEPYEYTIGTVNIIDVVYTKQQDIAYTINFYAGEEGEEFRLGSAITGYAAYGQNVTPANINDRKPSVGYDDADNVVFIISADPNDNVFDVVYPRQYFAYTIQFQIDGYDLDGSHRYSNLEGSEFTGSEQYGTNIFVSTDMLNFYLPEGYQAKTSEDEFTFSVSAEPSENIIQVTYSPLQIQYTVNYYTDNTDSNPIATEVGNAWYGSALSINQTLLNLHRPNGYVSLDGYRVIESLDYNNNVIDVVYAYKQTNLSYTIEYYLESITGEPFYAVSGQGVFGDEIPYVIPEYQPAGYDYENPRYDAVSITTNQQANVMQVVYQPAEYGYTVNYYQDSVDNGVFLGSKEGTAPFGTEIPYEIDAYLPAGYNIADAIVPSKTVTADASNNVVEVVYTTQPRSTVVYSVNYYGGSISPDNLLFSQRDEALVGTNIPYNVSVFDHAGYEGNPTTSGVTTVGPNAADNVLNVVIPVGTYSYKINYYRDQVDSQNLLGSDNGSGLYLSRIEARLGAYVPEGYSNTGRMVGATTITPDEDANVFNVVYSPNSFNYTVRYFRDSVESTNYLGSTTPGQGVFGTDVSVSADVLNLRLPQGYEPISGSRSVRITANPADNVLNVVYETPAAANAESENQEQSPLEAFIGGVQDAIAAVVDFFTPDEPEEITDDETPLASTGGAEQDIDDEGNPLASLSPDLPGSETNAPSNILTNILLLVAACGSALGAGLSLLFRKSVRDAFAGMSKKDLAYGEEKARTLTHRAVAFGTLSLILFMALIILQM